MKKCMMFAVALSVASVVLAESKTKVVDGVTYTYDGGTILKVESDAKTINVPAELDEGVPVTAIGTKKTGSDTVGAFQNNTTVMKVVLPSTVSYISARSFSGCISLISVNFPDAIEIIDEYSFKGCAALKHLTFGSSLRRIEQYAFDECTSLSSVVFEEGLEFIGLYAFAHTALVDVKVPNSVKTLGSGVFLYCSELTHIELPNLLTTIPYQLFQQCVKLELVRIPDSVTKVEGTAFYGCIGLKELIIPASVNSLENVGVGPFKNAGRITFLGKPPAGISTAEASEVLYPREFGALWRTQVPIDKFGGYSDTGKPAVMVVSTKVRENDPMILDVVYKVTSKKPTVKVRALAFEDGERSFAKVTRPETFIEGTAANVGDAVPANEEHKLSWKVSADFQTDLAKMKFEVLAVEDDILPFEFITIPANGDNKAMQLSWNLPSEKQYFDALLWLYADKTEGLTLSNGVLMVGDAIVADHNSIKPTTKDANSNYDMFGTYYSGAYSEKWLAAPLYIFTKMGFSQLQGDELSYANEMTRLGLNPSGIRQYAWRWVEQ